MRLEMFLGLVLGLAVLALPAPVHPPVAAGLVAQTLPHDLLSIARGLEVGMSRGQVMDVLHRHRLSPEMEADLPPDGRIRLLLVVPPDDDCLPRGEPLMCTNLRVYFQHHAEREARAVRIEAFQCLGAGATVAGILHELGRSMGPPTQSAAHVEQVRGGSVHLWRQAWEGEDDGKSHLEIMATWEGNPLAALPGTPPQDIATGADFIRTDSRVACDMAVLRRSRTDYR